MKMITPELVKWIDSKKELPSSELDLVLVCYAGLKMDYIQEGKIEISRASYIREEPQLYPFWMPLPKPPSA